MPPFLRWGGGTEESRGEYEGGRERDCHPNIFCQPDFTHHGTCVTLLLQTSWPDQRVPRHTWHLSPTLLPFCQDNTTMSSYHHQVLVEMPLNQHLPPPHTHPKVSQTIYRVASDSLTHSCKQKAGLQTEASSLLPFFAGEIKSGNKYLMLSYFSMAFCCYYSNCHSESLQSWVWMCCSWFLPQGADNNRGRNHRWTEPNRPQGRK